MSQSIVRRISGSLCKAVLSCRIRRVYLSRSWGCGYWRWGRFLWYFGILFGTWVIGLARGIFHKMSLFPVHHHWYKQEKKFPCDTKEGICVFKKKKREKKGRKKLKFVRSPPSGNNLNKWPNKFECFSQLCQWSGGSITFLYRDFHVLYFADIRSTGFCD